MRKYEESYYFPNLFKYREEIPRDTLGIWNTKGQCIPKVSLELYICKIITWERDPKTSLRMLNVWSVNEGGLILLIFFSPLSCGMMKCSLLVFSCYSMSYVYFSLMPWLMWFILSILCFSNLFISMSCLMWLSNKKWGVFDCSTFGFLL